MYSITAGFSPVYYTVDPMLLPSWNPFKCHEEVLYLQPVSHLNILTFSSLVEGCSEGLDAFRFYQSGMAANNPARGQLNKEN